MLFHFISLPFHSLLRSASCRFLLHFPFGGTYLPISGSAEEASSLLSTLCWVLHCALRQSDVGARSLAFLLFIAFPSLEMTLCILGVHCPGGGQRRTAGCAHTLHLVLPSCFPWVPPNGQSGQLDKCKLSLSILTLLRFDLYSLDLI